MTDPIHVMPPRPTPVRHRTTLAAILCACLCAAGSASAESAATTDGVGAWITALQRDWLGAIWRLSLFESKPKRKQAPTAEHDGFRFSRMFGERGPELRLSPSMPTDTSNCLHAVVGTDGAAPVEDPVEGFVILRYRW